MNENSSPTPNQINENPELAVLQILRASTSIARMALVATYPNLCDENSEQPRTEQDAYAMAIICQASTLEVILREYMDSVRRLRQWQNRGKRQNDIPF